MQATLTIWRAIQYNTIHSSLSSISKTAVRKRRC